MTEPVVIVIDGKPVAKGRPRLVVTVTIWECAA
jgi:hypothetical protein